MPLPPPLTADQTQFYADNGYVLVKGVFSRTEAADFRREAHALIERLLPFHSVDATWASIRATQDERHQTALQHCHDVQFHSALFTRLIVDPRLTSIIQALIGPNVQLHHTKLFVKPRERGSPFPMHQDKPYFPHDHDTMLAAVIHFDDAPVEKGCIRVVPGSHKLGLLTESGERDHSLPPDEFPIESATPCPAEAGDVLVFSYLTVHGSGVNTSNEPRTTLLVQMRDPTDPPTVRAHESRGQGMMLAGIDPSCCTTGAPQAAPAGRR